MAWLVGWLWFLFNIIDCNFVISQTWLCFSCDWWVTIYSRSPFVLTPGPFLYCYYYCCCCYYRLIIWWILKRYWHGVAHGISWSQLYLHNHGRRFQGLSCPFFVFIHLFFFVLLFFWSEIFYLKWSEYFIALKLDQLYIKVLCCYLPTHTHTYIPTEGPNWWAIFTRSHEKKLWIGKICEN